LNAIDPEAAEKIHPNDARRIIRALEVYRQTGRPISQLQHETQGLWGRHDIAMFALTMDRDRLYERIDKRVDNMFEEGLVDEIKSIQSTVLSKTAQAVIGIKEVQQYLAGESSLDQAKQEMKKNTRRLAKRQLTWFRSEHRIKWIEIGDGESADQTAYRILQALNPHE
jgi:tRNA dimethylallyltransferase